MSATTPFQPPEPGPHARSGGAAATAVSMPISRRSLLAGLGTIGFALIGAAACGNVSAPGSAPAGATTTGGRPATAGAGKKLELTMFVFLGADLGVMPKAFAKEWESSHPSVTINIFEESNLVGYPKMVARKKTNPGSPLVNFGFFNAQTTEQGIIDAMWHKLDYAAMPNAADIREQFKRPDQYGIGIGADQIGLVYNEKSLGSSPTSWAGLWDSRNANKVTYFGFPWYAVFMAAKLNGGGLDNMDPGFQTLAAHADNIRTIVTSNPQYLNVLSSGTAPLTAYFNGTGHQWIKGGAPLAYVPPKEGAVPVPVNLCVVDGQSEDQITACTDAVNEMISPKWCAQWAQTSIEIPGNEKSTLPADLAKLPAFSEATINSLVKVDYATVGKQTATWTDQWQRDVVSKI